MKHLHTFESFLNEVATPRLLKSAGQNLARQVKDKKNYTVDQLKDRLMSTPIARMLSDDEILIVLDHAKEELGMNESATNEAMVQVAGKGKPSGAMVLAKVILEFLSKEKHLTPAADRQLVGLEDDIAKIIMDSTF